MVGWKGRRQIRQAVWCRENGGISSPQRTVADGGNREWIIRMEASLAFIARVDQIAAMHGSASTGGRARTRLDQFAGSVEIEARKFAINLAADWRNIHEEQSFPGYFWLADQECSREEAEGADRFLSRQERWLPCYRRGTTGPR